MRATYVFKRQVLWCYNEKGHPEFTFYAGDKTPGVKHVLWCEDEKGYEFSMSDGSYVFVPDRNITSILYEKDLPELSEVPDE